MGRLDRQDMHFTAGHGSCSTPVGATKMSPGLRGDGAIPRLDVERSLEHKKEIIRVVMPMPGMAR